MIETVLTNPNTVLFYPGNVAPEDKAKLLHRLLLDLSKSEDEKELRSAVRQTADFFREKFFGFSEAQIRSKIIACLEDYFDGVSYTALEIDNLAELTGIREDKLLPVVEGLVASGELEQGRRRRWQEMGKHYCPIYRIKK